MDFAMDILPEICSIFSEKYFLGTPLEGYFWKTFNEFFVVVELKLNAITVLPATFQLLTPF